jgi:hypothetical protein
MADYKHPAQQAAVQHLEFLQQQQTPGAHNPWAAEAALEAHLKQQQSTPHQVGVQLRLQQRQ